MQINFQSSFVISKTYGKKKHGDKNEMNMKDLNWENDFLYEIHTMRLCQTLPITYMKHGMKYIYINSYKLFIKILKFTTFHRHNKIQCKLVLPESNTKYT